MNARIEIVPVDEGNVRAAGRVHSASWQASHRAFCTPDFVAMHGPDRQTRYLRDKLAGGSRLFLMTVDGEAAGVVSVTGSLIEDLYILPRLQRQGLGTALLRHAMDCCDDSPILWILENNTDAERLYLRMGFMPTGRRNAITEGLDEVEYQMSST